MNWSGSVHALRNCLLITNFFFARIQKYQMKIDLSNGEISLKRIQCRFIKKNNKILRRISCECMTNVHLIHCAVKMMNSSKKTDRKKQHGTDGR